MVFQDVDSLLSNSAALVAKSGCQQNTNSPKLPIQNQLRETRGQMQEVVSKISRQQSSRFNSNKSSRRVSCAGTVNKKPPDLAVAVGKVLKASREARPRQSLASWPIGLAQHVKSNIKVENESFQQTDVSKQALSASVIRLRHHQTVSRVKNKPQEFKNPGTLAVTSPEPKNATSTQIQEYDVSPAMTERVHDNAVASSETQNSDSQDKESQVTTNPLWESFEGFKLHTQRKPATPQFCKKNPIAESPENTPQLLAQTPANLDSPADFHSPTLCIPMSTESLRSGQREPRESYLDDDTPEHLSLRTSSPRELDYSASKTPSQPAEKKRTTPESKKEKSHKKGTNIFARFLQASGELFLGSAYTKASQIGSVQSYLLFASIKFSACRSFVHYKVLLVRQILITAVCC